MQKNSKNKKTSSRFHLKTKPVKTGRKIVKKKSFLPVRSNLTRGTKFRNKCKKILKIKKHHLGSFQDETDQNRPKNREQKKFPSYPFEPDPS